MKKWQAFVGVVLVAGTPSWPKSSAFATAVRVHPLIQIVEKLFVRPPQRRVRIARFVARGGIEPRRPEKDERV